MAAVGASEITTNKANAILNDLFYQDHYIGLSTTTPTSDGGNINEPPEVMGYARVRIGEKFVAATQKQIWNSEMFTFPEALGDWGTPTYIFVSRTETGVDDDVVFFAPINSSVRITEGHVPIFRRGALNIGLDKSTMFAVV